MNRGLFSAEWCDRIVFGGLDRNGCSLFSCNRYIRMQELHYKSLYGEGQCLA
jgi:hypothetical protein